MRPDRSQQIHATDLDENGREYLLTVTDSRTRGAGRVWVSLASALPARGYRVDKVLLRPGGELLVSLRVGFQGHSSMH